MPQLHPIGYIVLTFKMRQEGNRWVALCEELGTSSYGHNMKEAQERIYEAVELHLNALEMLGERKRFFAENNITIVVNKPNKKRLKMSGPFEEGVCSVPYVFPIHEELITR
jgi:predicted RNase H-like HicB family nuclease